MAIKRKQVYKETMLNYIDKIIYVNENYKESKEMDEMLEEVRKEVKKQYKKFR